MPFTSSLTGSFTGGRRASTDSFAGLAKSNRIIVHYDPSDNTSYDGSSTTLTDLTSNGYNGTIVGGPTFDTDHFSLSANDYFVTPDISSDIPADDTHTVELWFYPTGDNGVLVQYQGQATPNSFYHFSGIEMVSGQLEFGLWQEGSGLISSGPTGSVTLNTWHQVVMSYDGSHIRGYLDGVRVCKTAATFDSPSDGSGASGTGFYLSVGENTATNQGDGSDFEGRVGIFRVYNTKLNRNAIRRNYLTDKNTHSAPSSPWDPSTDITPALWYDASDTSSYTLSSSTLNTVTDKAGNFVTSIDGSPTRISSGLNGLNVWDFDGSESIMTGSGPWASGGNHWAVGVFQWNAVDDTKDSFWSTENNTVNAVTNKRDYAVSAGNSSQFNGELDLDSLGSNRISTTIGDKQALSNVFGSSATWQILSVFFNKAGNQIGARVDGANAFTPVNDYDNSLTPNLDLRIFRNRSSERMSGKLAEFFTVADAPGTGIINMSHFESAEGYLAHKWGLQGLLPADHPHKANAP